MWRSNILLDAPLLDKPYDALARMLLEAHPADWLALLGLGRDAPVQVVNSDVSTVTAEADKVLLIEAPAPWIVHVEVQTSHKTDLPRRLLRYNALLNVRHDLPVHSVAVLLFPEADGPAIDGVLRQASPDGRCRLELHYQVTRIWEASAEELAAGLGTVPLAALVLPSPEDLPPLVDRLKAAFALHPTPDEGEIWTALYILIGRRFRDDALADRLLRGIRAMQDSVTYQKIVGEGERKGRIEGQLDEARVLLLRLGARRFSEPDPTIRQRIGELADLERLERMIEQVLTAGGWDELIAEKD
jgi:predicted transposase YdaD